MAGKIGELNEEEIAQIIAGVYFFFFFFFIGNEKENARGEKFADHGRCDAIKIDGVMKH